MAVKFEFMVTDAEAEIIKDMLRREISTWDESIMHALELGFTDQVDWYHRHKELLVDLNNRMTNTRV